MRKVFCTIITSDFIPFARILHQSLTRFDKGIEFYALIINGKNNTLNDEFNCLYLNDLSGFELVDKIKHKYSENLNALRWSLKSVLLIYLLKKIENSQVFFVDPDICFFSDFSFLYKELGEAPILLCPHWGSIEPKDSEEYFHRHLTNGLYNAGFIGATFSGIKLLNWWASMCLFSCERNLSKGLFDDQKYLDLFPIIDPQCKVLIHRGCNVAEWNRFMTSRSLDSKGDLLLNGIYPVVFIHFTNIGDLLENDLFLVPYFLEYEKVLKSFNYDYSFGRSGRMYLEKSRLRKLSKIERIIRKVIGPEIFSNLKNWN